MKFTSVLTVLAATHVCMVVADPQTTTNGISVGDGGLRAGNDEGSVTIGRDGFNAGNDNNGITIDESGVRIKDDDDDSASSATKNTYIPIVSALGILYACMLMM